MPEPKGKGAGRGRRAARGKGVAKGRRSEAKRVKPAVVPEKTGRAAAKPVGVPPVSPAVPKASPVAEKRVEATRREKEGTMVEAKGTPEQYLASILTPEYSRTGHICWDCKHFKPVLKGSKFPPADTIGWCTQIHWPFFWCITNFNEVKKCYAFEKGVYTPYQPARFP
jgi:hypothetical protein